MTPLQLGFPGERNVDGGYQVDPTNTRTRDFYTCSINQHRAFVWEGSDEMMLLVVFDKWSDHITDPAMRTALMDAYRGKSLRIVTIPADDPLLLVAAIHHLTSGGNTECAKEKSALP